MSTMLGKRFKLEIDRASFEGAGDLPPYIDGEYEIVEVDANDIHIPYYAKNVETGIGWWLTPELKITCVRSEIQKITRLN